MALRYWNGTKVPKDKNAIMVFGSNPEGRHGMGAALQAKRSYGAIYGQGRGLQGNAYALITKNLNPGYVEKSTGIKYRCSGKFSVSLEMIRRNVDELYQVARQNPELDFYVIYQLKINPKNLNGYSSSEILKQFIRDSVDDIPGNILFHDSSRVLFEVLQG